MKKILLVAMMALGFAMNAQENLIKANPLALLGGTDLVSYERVVGENSTVLVSGAIGGFKLGGVKYDSKGFGAQYRYYFDEALKGWYAAAGIDYQFGSVESGGDTGISINGQSVSTTVSKTDFSAFGGGVRAGYQWVWDSGFSLDLNLGAVYSSFNYESDNNDSFVIGLKGSGILPTFGLGLGYAW